MRRSLLFLLMSLLGRPLLKDVNPEVDVLATPTVTEEVVADGEKSNVEKWGQELQNRENILPWIRFTSNNTLQN
ncbi:hypothetical protein Bca4012_049263 [Brassica carinata]